MACPGSMNIPSRLASFPQLIQLFFGRVSSGSRSHQPCLLLAFNGWLPWFPIDSSMEFAAKLWVCLFLMVRTPFLWSEGRTPMRGSQKAGILCPLNPETWGMETHNCEGAYPCSSVVSTPTTAFYQVQHPLALQSGGLGVLCGCFGREMDGPGLPGAFFFHLPGPSTSPKRTPTSVLFFPFWGRCSPKSSGWHPA